MKKLVLLLAFSTILLAAVEDKKIDTSTFDKMKVEEILKYMSTEAIKQFPISLDESTSVIWTYSYKNELVYIKEIDKRKMPKLKDILSSEKSKFAFKKELYHQDRNLVCNNDFLLYLLDKRNALIKYKWEDEKALPLFDYTLNYKDCL